MNQTEQNVRIAQSVAPDKVDRAVRALQNTGRFSMPTSQREFVQAVLVLLEWANVEKRDVEAQ